MQRKLLRRSIRLRHFDYTQEGGYFITVCIAGFRYLLSTIKEDKVSLTEFGKIVDEEWQRTAVLRDYVVLDEYVTMPNHFHGIFFISDQTKGAARCAPTRGSGFSVQSGSVGAIVRAFKSATTKRINELRATPGESVWHRNYYEHVIRNEADLFEKRQYIVNNPLRWHLDKYYRDH